MSLATMPQPGDVVAGKYAIERILGHGGMGVVYEATHLRLRQHVALKMLLPEMLEHKVLLERFEREGQAAAKLKSRHAVRVLDVDVTPEGLPYLVMEMLQGRDVAEELAAVKRLPPEVAVDIVLQACAAMAEAHQLGIVHRDLKPSNLFLALEGGGERVVKVLDFGISKVPDKDASKLTAEHATMGTAVYMSPEQVHDAGDVDARTDVWALGVILFELLAGTPPWVGNTTQVAAAIVVADPPDLREQGISPELAAIVDRCLKKPVAERFADVRELATALTDHAPPTSLGRQAADQIGKGSSPRFTVEPPSMRNVVRTAEGATAPGWTQSGPRPRSSPMLVAVAVTFVVGLLVLGGSFFAWTRARPAPAAAPRASQEVVAPPVASSAPVAATTPSATPATEPTPSAVASTPAPRPGAKPGVKPAARPSGGAPPPQAPAPEKENPLTL